MHPKSHDWPVNTGGRFLGNRFNYAPGNNDALSLQRLDTAADKRAPLHSNQGNKMPSSGPKKPCWQIISRLPPRICGAACGGAGRYSKRGLERPDIHAVAVPSGRAALGHRGPPRGTRRGENRTS